MYTFIPAGEEGEPMDALNRNTTKAMIYEAIKKDILTQKYAMGERLNIDKIARETNVSNSPVREALNMLEQEGLVQTRPYAGPHVVNLTEEDMRELSQLILFWVQGCYEYCMQNGLLEQALDGMKESLRQQIACKEKQDIYHDIYCANAFDRCILAASGNTWILREFDRIFSLFYLCALIDYQSRGKDWDLSIRQHKEILQAIQEKRHEDVQALWQHHYSRHGLSL